MDFLPLVLILVFLTGFLFAPLGLGGGLLFVPILHYVGGLPLDASVLIISLVLTGCVSYGSGFVHRKEGLMSDEIIRNTAPFAFLGAVIGAFAVNAIGNSLDQVFKSLAMIVIIWALIKTTRRIRHGRSEKEGGEVETLPLRAGVGFGGMASAVLAIGAGAVYIPVLNQFGGLSSRRAIGTSLGLMMVVVPIAVLVHALLYSDPWPQLDSLALLVLGVIAGSVMGARIGLQISDRIILSIFVILLMIILSRYVWDLANQVFF